MESLSLEASSRIVLMMAEDLSPSTNQINVIVFIFSVHAEHPLIMFTLPFSSFSSKDWIIRLSVKSESAEFFQVFSAGPVEFNAAGAADVCLKAKL